MPSPATPRTARNSTVNAAQTSPHQSSSSPSSSVANARLNSSHSQISPIQNPRVSGIINGSTASSPLQGYSNSNSTSTSPPGSTTHRFYAASAPTSSTALDQQNLFARDRPPVPLFSHSTGNIPQTSTNTFVSNSTTGILSPIVVSHSSPTSLTSSASDMTTDFDFGDFSSASDATGNGLFDDSFDYAQASSFEPINQPAPMRTPTSSVQTVSPKDLLVDTMSAPPSTSFTDLTTPGTSYEQSPWLETSPLYSEADLDADSREWPSLFGSTDDFSQTTITNASVTPQPTAPQMSRTGSSPGQSSSRSSHHHSNSVSNQGTNNGGRHSFTAGVSSRRRDKPLPAITVEDPHDTIAVKRARNTMAARKSRQKRMERTDALEATVQDLEAQVEHWRNIAIQRGHVE